MKEHRITDIIKKSPADRAGIKTGEILLAINSKEIRDIFDYHYLTEDVRVELKIRSSEGEVRTVVITKDEDEDLGLCFAESLMDSYKSCFNKCMFCFIDQDPPGMRETIYFKDDDSRLSFLQGNYITMTNMQEADIERIIEYKLAPINISVHTTNPELRCKMLNNRFAGNLSGYMKRLFEAGIPMNAQIVLCKGINDGQELERTITDLIEYAPVLGSVSVVPVGLTKYREGLCHLEPFLKEDAVQVIEMIHKFQKLALSRFGIHFIHASDEWYINACMDIPEETSYDGYPQIENGVGMTRQLYDEFHDAVEEVAAYKGRSKELRFGKGRTRLDSVYHAILKKNKGRRVSTICGTLSYGNHSFIQSELKKIRDDIELLVYPIENDFFGPLITVTGLLTGRDILRQLSGRDLGDALLIPSDCLKADEDIFLDDMSILELQKALQVKTIIVKSNGIDYLRSIVGV